ncbi:MAG: hypothetical protein IPG06_20620 [Haliea sp.]|nr:hypothetical protein [Haliea sp.]
MKSQLSLRWVAAALLLLLSPPAWVDSSDESQYTFSISGLHRLSDTLEAIRDKGVFSYAGDQVGQAARGKLPELFGSTGRLQTGR